MAERGRPAKDPTTEFIAQQFTRMLKAERGRLLQRLIEIEYASAESEQYSIRRTRKEAPIAVAQPTS